MKKSLKVAIEKNERLKVFGNFIRIDGGDLYPLPLVDGNEKIGKGIWHASTLPTNETITAVINKGTENEAVISEMGTCPLRCPGCYATKGNYLYDDIKYYLIMRTRFLKNYPDLYFYVARCQIECENIKYIRLHASGDFIPDEAYGWYKIFRDMPDVTGWTYTKVRIAGNVKKLDSLNNFNIVRSIIPGCGFNYGKIAYIIKTYKKLVSAGKKVYICRCGIDKNQHCNNCTGCSKNDYVLFIEHGTGYNAKKDPLYDEIRRLIESQPKQFISQA